jgi:hypothetical protein
MLKSKIGMMLVLILSTLSLVTVGMTSNQQGNTPAQGINPEKQKEHAKLYKTYDNGPDLRKQAAASTGDITVEVSSPGKIYPSEPVSLPPFLNALACDADAIIIGIPKSGSSQFTENGSFIFTDYEVTVEQVLKDNIDSTIRAADSLIITRPGGSIQINGRTIRGNLEAFKPFNMNERYLLFLRFIPTTAAYRAFGIGSFQLRDNKVFSLGDGPLWGEINNLADAQAFITDVRTAAASNCETKLEVLR